MITLHSIDVRVYYEDTDAGGIVYYANYLKFFERSRSDWLRAQGVDHQRLGQAGLGLVVRNCHVDYRRPARLDDLLVVHTGVIDATKDIRRASIRLQHEARLKESNELLVSGEVQIACIRFDAMRAAPLPDEILTLLQQSANVCLP
ncbi:MAG: tol-pal system-associated acyl-CoA thioesterase [Lautropia sp.]|nr:tol-pal system-associated acyl-CoA thioesterase [Lautropia sp.]